LVFEGQPGIGKTTLWTTAVQRARGCGFRVLSARAADVESVSAYATLAELLAEVDPEVWSDLPTPQRLGVDQILSRTRIPGAPTEQRVVAAAFLSILGRLVGDGPVLLAFDDLQWLDPSSVHVLAYAARRLSGPIGVIGTLRTENAAGGDAASWLQLPRPDAVHRITVRPLSIRELHTVVTQHLNRPVSQAEIRRIHQISGGNPFYAVELARVSDGTVENFLPGTLAELVQARVDGLDAAELDVLLAAACLATPTVEVVTAAGDCAPDRVVELLESAEAHGVITIEGNRIRFTHPLLATAVYTNADADRRRATHRRLAGVVDGAELRAQHLALAGDPGAVEALEAAADIASARGAPAAAAEMLEMAISLGGDTADRRVRLAAHCFDAGDPGRARALLEAAVDGMDAGPRRAEARYSLAVVQFMDDGYPDASELLARTLIEDDPAPATRVKILTALAHALYNTGKPDEAMERAEYAVAEAERLDIPALLSKALGVRAMLHFLAGRGIDEPSLHRAEALEDHESSTPTVLAPSVLHALQLGWIGDLDEGYDRLLSIQRRCIERGAEGDLIFIDFQVVLNRIWRGDFATAQRVTVDATELARRMGGEFPHMLALVLTACTAVYTAAADEARQHIAEAVDASKRCGTVWHDDWLRTALGFLETSLGNYGAAVDTLQPLAARFAQSPDTVEIFATAFVPDLVEALAGLGRATEAEPLVAALEHHGTRLNRAWTLAIGARCRAMVLAARSDTAGALAAAVEATNHHGRLQMPFEQARTQLLVGQLQLRQRDRTAADTSSAALSAFDGLGTVRWADRAREVVSLAETRFSAPDGLTDTERRVAELAASGKTNREIADLLFVSAKTVEATLARVYRKLGIRSRAELGRRMGDARP
jgi:DNA-binding CsgD family transcriptional regulator